MEDIETLKRQKDAGRLIALSRDRGQDQRVRVEALTAIDEILTPASFVIHASEKEEKGNEFYRDIADNLAGVGYVRIINHLVSLLTDTNIKIRRVASQTLGHICSKMVVDPLVHSLETDDELIVQFAAIRALNDLVYKCRDVCNARAEQKLIQSLETKTQYDVRQEIADTLGALRSENAVPALINALSDIDWGNRHDVDWVLDGRKSALVMIGEPAVEPLILALKDEPDMHIKMGATWVLGEIRDTRAIKPLEDILANIRQVDKDSSILKWYIKKALGRIKSIPISSKETAKINTKEEKNTTVKKS